MIFKRTSLTRKSPDLVGIYSLWSFLLVVTWLVVSTPQTNKNMKDHHHHHRHHHHRHHHFMSTVEKTQAASMTSFCGSSAHNFRPFTHPPGTEVAPPLEIWMNLVGCNSEANCEGQLFPGCPKQK